MSLQRKEITITAAMLFLIMTLIITRPIYGQTKEEKIAAANKLVDEASVLRQKGTIELLRAAREKLNEAMEIYHSVGDRRGDASGFYNLGGMSAELGENQKALDYYNQSLPVLRQTDNKEHEAMVLQGIAITYNNLGEKRKAIDFYQQALLIYQSRNNRESEATALTVIGNWFQDIDKNRNALDYFEKALPVYQSLNNKVQMAVVLVQIGRKYDGFGEKQKALNYYNQAQLIYQSLGDKSGEAYMLLGLGAFYGSIGEFQKSLDYNNQALLIHRSLGEKEYEATALIGIGNVYSHSGEYQKALEMYNNSLQLLRSIGEKEDEAGIINQIGLIYSALGDNQKALHSFQQAAQIFTTIEKKYGEAITLNNIGKVYADLGENKKSIDFFNKALEINQITGDKKQQAVTLNNIGLRYSDKPQVSLKYFAQSLQLFRAIQDKVSEAITLNNIGLVYLLSNEYTKALENFNQSLIIAGATGDKKQQATVFGNISSVWDKQKNPRFAVFYGKQSINVYQQIRANIKNLDKETQKNYLKSIEPAFRGLADFLIQNNRFAEAQQTLNLFKDQQFFDFNNTKQTASIVLTEHEASTISAFEEKLETMATYSSKIDELRRNLSNREPAIDESITLKRLETDLQKANEDYLAFLKQAEIDFAATPNDRDMIPPVADLQQMQIALQDLSALTKQKTVAVYTLVGEVNYRALVITSDNIFAVTTPIKAISLNQKSQQLWHLLKTPEYDPQPAAKEIYDIIFAQITAKLPVDTKTILWSLDGNLRYVPMSALHNGKQYLVERYNNVVFTRADIERLTRDVSLNLKGIGFGSSQSHTVQLSGENFNASALPSVKIELSRIFKNSNSAIGVVPGDVLLDARFSKAALLSELQKRRPVVHIASHFKFEAGDEARSFLLLGDGTPFTLDEMKREQNLFAGVDLLTLSACQTAAQRPDASGREVDGLAELAQRLGAGAVMASLWEVADDSTAELMARFYRSYSNNTEINKAEALRTAQVALLNGTYKTLSATTRELKREEAIVATKIKIDSSMLKPYRADKSAPFAHPFYWSPFILVGNWK